MNTAELMKLLEEIPEPRKGNAIKHNLKDVLLIGLLCIICNGETFTDMELFGETHYEELKQY
ncbi:MAG: transposase family protein, partial [Clostridia bacterium]